MPKKDDTPQIDDSELEENPFYVDADGKVQARDVGGFAPTGDEGAEEDEPLT